VIVRARVDALGQRDRATRAGLDAFLACEPPRYVAARNGLRVETVYWQKNRAREVALRDRALRELWQGSQEVVR
jgi:hypothetical protein